MKIKDKLNIFIYYTIILTIFINIVSIIFIKYYVNIELNKTNSNVIGIFMIIFIFIPAFIMPVHWYLLWNETKLKKMNNLKYIKLSLWIMMTIAYFLFSLILFLVHLYATFTPSWQILP